MDATPPYERSVNTVFQSYALFPHMTVFENIGFGLRMKGLPAAEIRNRVEQMLSIVELKGYNTRRPSELSGGEQQRVALARALVNRPTVLLLDEPLGALDLKVRQRMQIELKRIQREVGITFIYVTHDQEEALVMSDRVAVMNRGRIEQVDKTFNVYERPATKFVAGFVGESNRFTGQVRDVGNKVIVDCDGLTLFSQACVTDSLKPGMPVEVVVRPEKIIILSNNDEVHADWNKVSGTIVDMVFQGANIKYIFDTSYALNAAKGGSIVVDQKNVGSFAQPQFLTRRQPAVAAWPSECTLLFPL